MSSLLLSLMLLVPTIASAATLADVTMEDKITVNGQTLVLNGLGLRKNSFQDLRWRPLSAGQGKKFRIPAGNPVVRHAAPHGVFVPLRVTRTRCATREEGLEGKHAKSVAR